MVPDDAAVSATYNLLPHLRHRAEIYSFPNPWSSQNFGIDGEPRRNPERVQWIVADRGVLDKESRRPASSGLVECRERSASCSTATTRRRRAR